MDNKQKVLVGVGSAIGALSVANVVKAALFKPKKEEFPTLEKENVNVDRYTETLINAIRCKTISHPDPNDMDWDEFKKLHELFEKQYPLMHKTLKKEIIGRAGLLYTWEGTDPSLKPIALIGHQDVVPVTAGTESDWKHPPFEGVIDDGYLYGRGAVDMKDHLCGVFEAVETLLEEGFIPKRTVYFGFGCNEEVVSSKEPVAAMISKTLEDRGVELESLLDEGGGLLGINIPGVMDKNVTGIGIAEKGNVDFEISIDAKGGHSSTPPNHSAVGELAKEITKIENHQFKAKILPEFMTTITALAKNLSFPARLIGCNIKELMPILTPILTSIPKSASLVRTTTAVTMTSGSPQANVMPQKAKATINFRLLPGQTVKDIEEHLRKICSKKVNIDLIGGNEASLISPTDSRTYNTIRQLSGSMNEKSAMVPYIVMGGTDARHYQNVCKQLYRYSPFKMSIEIVSTSHGTNERIAVSSFEGGISFFKKYIRTLASE